jgi:hypothetical protein
VLLHPQVLALLLISTLAAGALLLATPFALRVVRAWDLTSGSEAQVRLERGTYLVSTVVGLVLLAQTLSLGLFVFVTEGLSTQITGAMCATGTLNANAFGFPTLALKILLFFGAAAWLAVDRLDREGVDYPLVRRKYAFLVALTPLALAEAVLQSLYFARLSPEVITSCCGSLFSAEGAGVAAEVAALPAAPAMVAFYLAGTLVVALAARTWRSARGGVPLGIAAALAFAVALAGVVSFVSVYVYESPHHHCPFCLLKGGYDYLGYPLYAALFGGTACALGAGVSAPFAGVASLARAAPRHAARCAGGATVLLGAFYLLATWAVLRSNLVLFE